jgi:hypothetical protein
MLKRLPFAVNQHHRLCVCGRLAVGHVESSVEDYDGGLEEQFNRVTVQEIYRQVGVTERSNAATEERLKSGHAVGGLSIV